MLLGALEELVDGGHTVIAIEHNVELVRCADWIVHVGPEGGAGGGTLVASGPPSIVAANERSHTARFLR